MEMNLQLDRQRAIGLERKIVFLAGEMLEQRLAIKLHHVAHLGGENIIGALRSRFTDQLGSLFEARPGQETGAHLHHGRGEGEVITHEMAFSPASNESSLPARSSAYSSSQPPTWVSPMKICGKVEPAPARSHICCRNVGSVATSNSVNVACLRVSSDLAALQ